MAGFGEALVGAFNSTYGTISQGMLRREQALTLRQEREGQERFNQDARDDELRYNLRNPDGSLNRGNIAAAPSTPTNASGDPSVGGPTLQSEPAAAPLAPVPRARGNLRPPAAVAPPVAAPAAAPYDPAATPPRQVDSKEAPGGMAPPPAGEAARPRPPVTPEIAQELSGHVERRGNKPAEAMIAFGAIAPPPITGPGVPRAESFLPQLAQDMAQYRQEAGSSGPMTRADWDGYLTSRTLSAARNLSPQQQVQAMAVTDRIRVAGLQRFLSLGIAAAEAGDMEGAARALNGANSFVPDGYQRTVTATQGGVQIVSTREPGTAGTPGASHTVTVPAAAVVRYASTMMDPQWSMTHYLAVARHEETGRHNRATEGLAAANLGERRAERGERSVERAGSAEFVRRDLAAARAEEAVTRLEAAPAGQRDAAAITAARERATAARTAADDAAPAAGERGLIAAARLEEQRAGRNQRGEAARAQREGRAPITPAERGELERAEGTFTDRHTTRSGRTETLDPAADYAIGAGRRTFIANRDMPYAQVLNMLREFRQSPANFDVTAEGIRNRSSGVFLRSPTTAVGGSGLQDPPARPDAPPPPPAGTPPPGSRRGARDTSTPIEAAPELGGRVPTDILERAQRVIQDSDRNISARPARVQFEERVARRATEMRRTEGLSDRPTGAARSQWNTRNDVILRRAAEAELRALETEIRALR